MNLWIGNIRNYNNKILISSPSFKIGTNVKISLDGEQAKLKDEPDVKSKEVDNWRLMVKSEPDVKSNIDVKPNIELKHDVKVVRTKPGTNEITYKEEKVALVLGITSIFTVWWMFK